MPEALSNKGSVVSQVINLRPGQTYSRSRHIPSWQADPEEIRTARRNLVSYLTPVVLRARNRKDRNYHIHTTTAFTRNYDVIVTGVIVVEPAGSNDGDDEDDEL